MLNQNFDAENSGAPVSSAGQMRVKKDEFARAVAALEARRQSEAQAQEGTVLLGDVLQQLQIDLPPEEVLHEIEALHSDQPREKAARSPLWNADQLAAIKLIAGMFFVPVVAVGFAVLLLNPLRTQKSAAPSGSFSSGSANYSLLWTMPPPILPHGATAEVMDEGGFNASSVLKPLSSVPDNQPVHCTTASFNQLTAAYKQTDAYKQSLRGPQDPGKPYGRLDPAVLAQSTQLFDVRPNLHKPWTLIKHDGRLYLRGWVAGKFTAAQAKGQLVVLHSTRQSFETGEQPVPITLPMNFVQYGSFPSSNAQSQAIITTRFVSLDSHAWEKW